MAGTPGGRRERIRAETREEAKRLALRQISESGPWGLSLNAIARQMGVTGPALYRYFAGRDELLAELVADAYEDLADALSAAAQQPGLAGSPRSRLRAVAFAYRDWALSQPHRYLLLFGTSLPVGAAPAPRGGSPARRTVAVLFDVFADLLTSPAADAAAGGAGGGAGDASGCGAGAGSGRRGGRSDRRFEHGSTVWGERVPGHHHPAPVLRLALAAWTRLHGVVSLEIEGHLRSTGVDPTLVFQAEVDALLEAAGRLLSAG